MPPISGMKTVGCRDGCETLPPYLRNATPVFAKRYPRFFCRSAPSRLLSAASFFEATEGCPTAGASCAARGQAVPADEAVRLRPSLRHLQRCLALDAEQKSPSRGFFLSLSLQVTCSLWTGFGGTEVP